MNTGVVYLDSSAIIKLIFEEEESAALGAFLANWPHRASSALARIEVERVAASVDDADVRREARRVLKAIHLLRIDDEIVSAAATTGSSSLRALDAIHLATALRFGADLAGMIVYDRRLANAAEEHDITVWSPA